MRITPCASVLALEVAAFDEDAAMQFGPVRAELARRGKPIGALDTLIAAHAVAVDAILVTHNTREFSQVEPLSLEDWI